ncbi:hypothetical protein Lal_00030199 [Lupinus albus]|nr:hypothetical protein Lal_00030199 [Lupinus albus]
MTTLMKYSKTTMVFSLTLGCVSSVAPQKSHISLHLLQPPLLLFHLQAFPKCNRLPGPCNRLHCVNSPKLSLLAQARQLSLRRESSSIAQDFTVPGDPFSLRRESLAQARKTLILKHVMHTQEMRNNLDSGFLHNKVGYTYSIWADLYPLTRNEIFVMKGYATRGMFKLNIDVMMNKISNSICMLCYLNVWHARLCLINKRAISNLSDLDLIPKPSKMILKIMNHLVKLK